MPLDDDDDGDVFHPLDDGQVGESVLEQEGDIPGPIVPKRVLVFTTIKLLALFSMVSDLFLDGTFKVDIKSGKCGLLELFSILL